MRCPFFFEKNNKYVLTNNIIQHIICNENNIIRRIIL